MPMRNRYKSLFPLSSSIPNSLIHSTMHTRVGSLRIIYIFFIIFFLLTSYSLYTIYTTSHQRPPVMPFVDFQTSFGYKKNLMQHGVKELCDKIEWKQNAYLDCYSRMGTFNAINFVQTCMREAMDAGLGLVRPKIYSRDTFNLSNLEGPLVSLDYILDEEFLWKSLEVSCPQMKVVEQEFKQTANIFEIGGDFKAKIYYRGDFNKFINKQFSEEFSSSSSSSPIIIRQKYSLLHWNVDSDTMLFQKTFRDLFHLHPRYEKVAILLLDKLPYNFIGVHLRTESDFIEVDKFEEELLEIMEDVNIEMETPIIYLASGELSRTKKFKELANRRGITVEDKWSLIDEKIKKELDKMDFDQMALVDYIVLHHSQFFKGAGLSSFSYSLVMSRYFYQFGTFYYNPEYYVLGRQSQLTKWINNVFVNAMW